MARGNSSGSGAGLLKSLRDSPETKRLTEEARHLFEAGTGRLTGKLGDGATGIAKKLTDVGESGSLGFGGEGAKRMLSGEGPVKSAVGAATSGITDKAKGLFGKGGKGGKGGSKTKAMNIEETIDIGVPISIVYDQWTQFQDFSRFMKGVESVEQTDDTETTWRTKVFKSRRNFKSTIQEQIPDRRIVWTSEGSKGSTKGVVTFHPLADDLTRVLIALEYYPSGVVEKTGNLWRAAGRRTRLDLKNFRRFVMMENEATGSWRGEIRDGEVVKGPDETDQGGEETRSGDENDDEARAEDDESQDEDSQDEDSQDDERLARRRRPAAKAEPEKKPRRSRPAKKSTSSGESPRGETRKSTPAKKSASSSRSPRKEPSSSSRGPAKKSAGSSRSPAQKSSSSSRGPAKQSAGSSGSPAQKSSSSSGSPAQKSSSSSRGPAKQSAGSSRGPAKKSAASSRSPRKQATKRAPAKKQTSKRAPAKKSSSSSRSPRKQATKRTPRKRTSS